MDKYKMFRNFMVNELGITRDDIKQWTKEAVKEVAEKQLGQINVDEIVNKHLKARAWETVNTFKESIAKEIVTKLNISIK